MQWVSMLGGGGGAQGSGTLSPLPEPPPAARTQQLSPWDRHECRQRRQRPGVTAGAIRSWQAAGKQDDERVTGRGEGGAWPCTGAGSPRSAAGVTPVRRTPGEEGSITHLPRSKGALGPPHQPRGPPRTEQGAGMEQAGSCCPFSGRAGVVGAGGRGVSPARVPTGPGSAVPGRVGDSSDASSVVGRVP